jgi:hypothetical protein
MVLRRQGDDVLFRAIVGRAPFVERKLRAGPSSFARLAPAAASIRAVRSQAVTSGSFRICACQRSRCSQDRGLPNSRNFSFRSRNGWVSAP